MGSLSHKKHNTDFCFIYLLYIHQISHFINPSVVKLLLIASITPPSLSVIELTVSYISVGCLMLGVTKHVTFNYNK